MKKNDNSRIGSTIKIPKLLSICFSSIVQERILPENLRYFTSKSDVICLFKIFY